MTHIFERDLTHKKQGNKGQLLTEKRAQLASTMGTHVSFIFRGYNL